MKKPTLYKQIALAAIACVLVVPTLRADTYVTNLADTTTSYFSMNSTGQPDWVASQFTTDASATSFTLSSVPIYIYDTVSPGSPFSVQVFSNVAGAPGSALGTLSGNSAPPIAGTYTYTATGISLNSSTSYWVVAELTGGSTYRWASTTDAATGTWTIVPDVLISSDSGTVWTAPLTSPGSMQYDVVAEAVPEPSTYAMLGLGIPAMLGAMRLRQRRA